MTNPGEAHDNGAVEAHNNHLKTALDQGLILRGSRDFATLADWRRFVDELVARRNRRREAAVCAEMAVQEGRVPAHRLRQKQRGSLTTWFDPDMAWVPPATGKRGRQSQYSDAAIQTCLTMKALFGMGLMQTTGFVESLLRLVGLD